MRISDWSSDVCSSDLALARPGIGRNLVALPTSGSRSVGNQILHGRTRIVVRHGRWILGKDGIGLQRKVVQRQMPCLEGHGLAQEIGRAAGREKVCQYV